jgi:hypothetical protein
MDASEQAELLRRSELTLRSIYTPWLESRALVLLIQPNHALFEEARAGKPVLGARPLRETLLAILQSSEKVE